MTKEARIVSTVSRSLTTSLAREFAGPAVGAASMGAGWWVVWLLFSTWLA